MTDIALELVRSGLHAGPLDDATGYGVVGVPGDGPWIEIWLVLDADRIQRAAYRTHGCPSSQVSAAMACRLAMGRTLEEARRLTGQDLLLVLNGLPEGKGHFADMAAQALGEATRESSPSSSP